MIQFGDIIFFKWGFEKPPTSKWLNQNWSFLQRRVLWLGVNSGCEWFEFLGQIAYIWYHMVILPSGSCLTFSNMFFGEKGWDLNEPSFNVWRRFEDWRRHERSADVSFCLDGLFLPQLRLLTICNNLSIWGQTNLKWLIKAKTTWKTNFENQQQLPLDDLARSTDSITVHRFFVPSCFIWVNGEMLDESVLLIIEF